MKDMFKRAAALLLALALAFSGLVGPSNDARAEEEPTETPAIYPLTVSRQPANLEAAGQLQPYADCAWGTTYPELMSADLSKSPGLAYSLSFTANTALPPANRLPAGFDAQELLEWGKIPASTWTSSTSTASRARGP